jgi:hypothetical protein
MPASNGNAIGLDFVRLDSLVRVFVGVDPQLHRRRWAGEAIRIEITHLSAVLPKCLSPGSSTVEPQVMG